MAFPSALPTCHSGASPCIPTPPKETTEVGVKDGKGKPVSVALALGLCTVGWKELPAAWAFLRPSSHPEPQAPMSL